MKLHLPRKRIWRLAIYIVSLLLILVALVLWYQLGATSRALGWAAFGLILFEWGMARKSLHPRLQGYVATAAAFCYMFVGNLDARLERNQILFPVLPLIVIFCYIYERLFRERCLPQVLVVGWYEKRAEYLISAKKRCPCRRCWKNFTTRAGGGRPR